MGEKLKFRPMPGELILLPEVLTLGTTLQVVATGRGCTAQTGNRVQLKQPKVVVNGRVVKIDGVSYHMHRDDDVQVIHDEEGS